MLGIFSLLSEAKVPGAVPPLAGLIPAYSGNCMVPFEGDFSISSIFFVNPEAATTQSARPLTPCDASRQEMEALAEANPDFLGKSIGFWDPLGCLGLDFWNIGNEATIGYLRHAEIKHGRVAMAGFLGYLAQSTDLVSGPHTVLPFRGYEAGLTPPEQWDAIPLYGKLQILVFDGMLESYGEGAGDPDGYVHYTKGGLPGYFPPIAGRAGFGQVTLNLYDPLGWFNEDKDKVRGRQVEINNGRLAMLGIFSLLSEAKVPGAVPPLAGLIPAYSGNCMVPFEGDFSISSIFFVNPEAATTQSARPLTHCDASKQEMAALAEANPDFLGKSIGLWDPLNCLEGDFWSLGNEATIGYLRHAEIKHGRVAMAAFLGYIAQSTDLVSGPHTVLPFRGYEAGLPPPEQWDAIPLYGKLQILVFVGMLESYGEGAGSPDGYVHYTKGGLPGYFPPIEGRIGPFPIGNLNLYKPFPIGNLN